MNAGYNREVMHVGVCRLSLRIPENDNIKGKRRVAHSISSKVRAKFNVAIAEIEDQEAWQRLTFGLTCVSNDGRHANSMLSNVVRYIERQLGDVELLDYEIEIIDGA